MRLSIIIPCYNAEPYVYELIDQLRPQLKTEVEVILVDDGSQVPVKEIEGIKMIRQDNAGPAAARNKGLDIARGEYIAFIDADDLVAEYYVETILNKINEHSFDVCDLSWRSLSGQGTQFDCKLRNETDRLQYPSVCTRVFRREYIGDVRFNERKDAAEDEEFSRCLGYLSEGADHTAITEYMYFYRTYTVGSNTKAFKEGLTSTKRITYYYPKVTSDMIWLVDQIKRDDEENEVWLLTDQNEIPELSRWCQISKPMHLWTHYLKGEPYTNCEIIEVPPRTQVALYINHMHIIGGIESFIYYFSTVMSKYYDITLIVEQIPVEQLRRLLPVIEIIKYRSDRKIICDTLIMLRITDKMPDNIIFKQSVQMCHTCKTNENYHISQDRDYIVSVSEISKDSFGTEAAGATVIHNVIKSEKKRALFLISATRIPAPDKGENEKRMRKLAEMLNDAGIPFLWLNFSEGRIENPPRGFYNVGISYDLQAYISRADYLVQLSDSEAYSYAVLEALLNDVPVIVTPFASASEMKIEDGVNGYIIPFNMEYDVTKLLHIPRFHYKDETATQIKRWRKILGNTKPTKSYNDRNTVRVLVTNNYYDIGFQRLLTAGETVEMSRERATKVIAAGYIRIA